MDEDDVDEDDDCDVNEILVFVRRRLMGRRGGDIIFNRAGADEAVDDVTDEDAVGCDCAVPEEARTVDDVAGERNDAGFLTNGADGRDGDGVVDFDVDDWDAEDAERTSDLITCRVGDDGGR